MELATELVLEQGEGRVATLLGLSLDEFGSRQRHAPHSHHHRHHAVHRMSPFEREVLLGFLAFATLYGLACTLLAYASIVRVRWASIPWLILHALCIASQAARVVDQVSEQADGREGGHRVMAAVPPPPPLPTPSHPLRDVLELQVLEHEEQELRSARVALVLAFLHLAVCVYMWLAVLLAQRDWSVMRKPYRPAAAVGDEGYGLTEVTEVSASGEDTKASKGPGPAPASPKAECRPLKAGSSEAQ